MINAGAYVNHTNVHGNTALHYACFWRYSNIVLYLAKTAAAHVKISNNYDMVCSDHTSKLLADGLAEIAEGRGQTLVRASSTLYT